MKIQIDDISSDGLAVVLDDGTAEVRAVLSALGLEHAGAHIAFEANLVRQSELVHVTGHITGHAHVACARCLEEVDLSIDDAFQFYLRPPLRETDTPEGAEVELSADDLDYGFLVHGIIDIESLVQEQLALALPAKVLCRPDCQGICQGCGALLNHEPCRCEEPVVDERWAKLRLLKHP